MTALAQAEHAVLAACLESQVARKRATGAITGADFADPAHETIWDATQRLDRQRIAVDATTVMQLVASNHRAREVMVELASAFPRPDSIDDYARIIRGAATKRRLTTEAQRTIQAAENPDANGETLAASIATRFATIRDSGSTDDVAAKTLAELLAEPDDPFDWIIPGILERSDRLVLTGIEGLGKSYLLRQIAVAAAAGLHPFSGSHERIEPVKSLILDAENTERSVKRKSRPLVAAGQRYGIDPAERVMVECPGRIDLTRDRDLAHIHQVIDAFQPDLVVIGPLYRLVPRAIQTDDEAAPLLAALDTIRDRNIALLIEAHAGHGKSGTGNRDMRPRGSSALLGWPEFGYGMTQGEIEGEVELVAWRGDRDERNWPDRMDRGGAWPWTAINYHGKAISR